MQAAKSIGVNKRPLGHSPLRRAAAIAMIVFGVIFFVAGVYGYLVNDLRCVNQELFTRVARPPVRQRFQPAPAYRAAWAC